MTDGSWEALFISAASAIGWGIGQLQAHSLSDRKELAWRRRRALVMDRYIARLEHELSSRDIEVPPKPQSWEQFTDPEFMP